MEGQEEEEEEEGEEEEKEKEEEETEEKKNCNFMISKRNLEYIFLEFRIFI
jgi:hypothetical protein